MYQNSKLSAYMLYLTYANFVPTACNSQMYERNILCRNINMIIAPKLFNLQHCFYALTYPFERAKLSAEPE